MLESVEGTAKFVDQVAEALRPTALYLSSNSDLELLPRDLAERKISLLGEVRTAVKEALS